MGHPKALLSLDGKPFLERVLEAFAAGGCDPLVVVYGGDEQEGAAEIVELASRIDALVVTNPDPDSEQLQSIRLALDALPDELESVVITPVDAPSPHPDLIGKLITASRVGAAVTVPAWKGRRGHPILFTGPALRSLRHDVLDAGARSVLHAFRDQVVEVEANSAGILLDIDTPEKYRSITEVHGDAG